MAIALTALPQECGRAAYVWVIVNGGAYMGTATRSTPADDWTVTGMIPGLLTGLLAPALEEGTVVHCSANGLEQLIQLLT